MTVTAAMIGYVSPYTVSDSGSFTTALFQYYTPIAATLLIAEDIDSTSGMYDHCHALMIAHLFAVKGGDTALKSFSSGNLQWSKEPGVTPQLLEIRRIVASLNEEAADVVLGDNVTLSSVIRADADVGNLKLDRTVSPVFFRGM